MKLIDNNNLLTSGQAQSLRNQASLSFSFGGFQSLDDILSKLNVDVRIEPGIVCRPVPSWLSGEITKCRGKLEQARQDPSKKEEFNALCQKLDELGANAQFLNTPLRGLYDSSKNEVILYPEEMSQEYNGKCVDELLLSTLSHETMHAYFNRPGHKKFNYIMFIEEPLAELGMLLYLHETNSQYYSWAYDDVRKKKTCYRFGAGLMDQCISEGAVSPTRSNLEDYKNINLPSNYYPTIIANKNIILPSGVSSIPVYGLNISIIWNDVFAAPPKYYYDASTNTLAVDNIFLSPRYYAEEIGIRFREIENIYLGENILKVPMQMHKYYPFFDFNFIVSNDNPVFLSKHGILLHKESGLPFLPICAKDLYIRKIYGKYGIVDSTLFEVIPSIFDYIVPRIDVNQYFTVKYKGKFGLIDKKGKMMVDFIYDDIKNFPCGNYIVKMNSEEFRINKYGNRI